MPELRLVLPYPPSANAYWRAAPGRGLVPSDEARRYKAAVALLLAGKLPLTGDVAVNVHVYRPRRSGDLDNTLKVLLDALGNGQALLDDAQVIRIHACRAEDAANPRVEVLLVGDAFATREQVAELRARKTAANAKRKRTIAANRRAG